VATSLSTTRSSRRSARCRSLSTRVHKYGYVCAERGGLGCESDDADEGPIRPAPRAVGDRASAPPAPRRAGGPAYRLLCGACFRPASRRGRIYEHEYLVALGYRGMRGSQDVVSVRSDFCDPLGDPIAEAEPHTRSAQVHRMTPHAHRVIHNRRLKLTRVHIIRPRTAWTRPTSAAGITRR